ncbi:methyltransferase domain protein [Ceratobasidium sp. AG-Ba]|nr:methyltransferase domain protein [Ceratobasidium sp. AG-Ba]
MELDGAPIYFIDDIHSDDEQSDPELYSSSSSASRSAETLASSEVHDFFQEVNGRMFPSDEGVAINLPTDSAELQRCINQHRVFKAVLKRNYWGPVEQVLTPIPGEVERKQVLDMMTAEGTWVQEMAHQFPHVDFVSVDAVPLTAHVPRSNITFEVYDLYNGIAAPDESFDIVHMRQATANLRNPKDLIRDIHRVLKPGGLFLFCDSEIDVYDGLNPEVPAGDKLPGLTKAFRVVREALGKQNVCIYLWRDLPALLSPESDLWVSSRTTKRGKGMGFRSIRHKAHILPGSPWPTDARLKALSELVGPTWKSMWTSMEIPFQMFGMTPEEAKEVVQGAVSDIDRTDVAVAARYHTLCAFKI